MATRQNLCINPACKNNTTSWSGSATYARSTSLTGMPRTTGINNTGTSGFVQTPTGVCAASDVITISFYLKNNTGSSEPSGRDVFVAYTRSVGGDTFPESFSTAALGDDGNVQRVSRVCAAAPLLATGIYLVIDNVNISGIQITAVHYEITGTLGDYFDGDTANATWDGSDGNSSSTLSDVVTVTGTASVALGGLAGTSAGTPTTFGTAAATLGGLSTAAAGTPTTPGTAATALGGLAAAATGGRTVFGIASAALGGLGGTGAGTRSTAGTASATLGGLAAAAVQSTTSTLAGNAHGPLPLALGAVTVHTGTIAGAIT